MKEIMKRAHQMTREMVEKYGVDYQAQLGLSIAYLLENKEEEKMVEITEGSEKQIAWATEIRNTNIKVLEREINEFKLREENGTGSFPELVAKLEKALQEIKTVEKSAKFWIEHRNLANGYIQKIKRK